MIRRVSFLSAAMTAWILCAPAYAAEAPVATDTPAPPTSHKATTGPAASLQADRPRMETEKPEEKNRFPDETWAGLRAGEIKTLLFKWDPASAWPSTASLMQDLLAAEIPWPENDSLQALRMQKLINSAGFKAAGEMYKAQSEDPPDGILRPGILALLAGGETGLGCLEINAHTITAEDATFHERVKAFCADLAARDENAPVVPITFEAALKQVPVALMVPGEHIRMPFGPGADWDIPTDVPPAVAYVLAERHDLPLPLRLKLAVHGGRSDIPAGSTPDQATPRGQEAWAQAAYLYRAQANLTPATRLEFVKKVLALPPALPLTVSALFAPTLAATDPSVLQDKAEIRRGTAILLMADLPQANVWLARLKAVSGNNPQHSLTDSSLLLLGQLRGHSAAAGPLPLNFSAVSGQKQQRAAEIILRISDFLDIQPGFIDTPPDLYVKKLGLTRDDHYVMHWSVLRDHLSDSAKKKQIGRAVLASLLVLQDRTPETIDPDVLATVLQTMVAVGLKEEARQIATPVLLGVTEE